MASSSKEKITKTLAPYVSLDDLSDDLKVKISACVAASSLQDFLSLLAVSKSFNRLSTESCILSGASLDISKLRWNRSTWNPYKPFYKQSVNVQLDEAPAGARRKTLYKTLF